MSSVPGNPIARLALLPAIVALVWGIEPNLPAEPTEQAQQASTLGDTVLQLGEQYEPVYLERLPDSLPEVREVDALFMSSDYVREHVPSEGPGYTMAQARKEPRELYKAPLDPRLASIMPGASFYLVVGRSPAYWHSFFGLKDGQVYPLPTCFKSLLSACGVQFAEQDIVDWIRLLSFVLVGNGEFGFEDFPPYTFEEHNTYLGGPSVEQPEARREAILSGVRSLCPSVSIDSVVTDRTSDIFRWWTVKVYTTVRYVQHILRVMVVPYAGGHYYPLMVEDSAGKYGHHYLLGASRPRSTDGEKPGET